MRWRWGRCDEGALVGDKEDTLKVRTTTKTTVSTSREQGGSEAGVWPVSKCGQCPVSVRFSKKLRNSAVRSKISSVGMLLCPAFGYQ